MSELQLKVKELETHSEGGPYQELLLAIRRGVDHAQVLLLCVKLGRAQME